MPNDKLLLTGKISKIAWKFAIPSIISMVVFALYNIVDRIFIGNIPGVGSLAMTGVGLTAPITTVAFAFAMLIGAGASTLISLKLGENKPAEANQIFRNGLQLMILIDLILLAACWWLLEPMLHGLGVDESTIFYAQSYIVIVAIGFLFQGLSNYLSSALRAASHPQVATVCNVIGTVVNIILDAWFVFGLGWGVAGAAWATIISQLLGLLVVVFFFRWKRKDLVLKIGRPSGQIDWFWAKKIAQNGFAPFAMQIANCVVLILMNGVLLKYGGNMAVAAMTIIFSVQNLALLPMIGFVQGQQPIIGFNYGAHAYKRVRQTVSYAIKAVLGFGVLATLILVVFRRQLSGFLAMSQS